MMKKTNYSYIGIAFIILVFGIYFIPRIIDRITNNDVSRKESRSDQKLEEDTKSDLAFIEINGEPKKVPAFSFINQDGKIISNKDYEGKVYVVEFFFTTCPTICPRMNSNLVQIQEEFKDFENFGVASFTINPEYDTPEILKQYAEEYGITNPNWHLMTGDQNAIYKLSNEGFNLYTAEEKDAAGGFEHSGNFALIDKNGFIRSRKDAYGNPIIYYKGIVSEEEKVDDDGSKEEISALKQDIKKLLNE
ncbi:MAG: SCO family protein [Flavobacteriales bacterium]